MTIYDFIDSLCCPDCKANIEIDGENLICMDCKRTFRVYYGICADMLPSKKSRRSAKTELERKSFTVYNKLFDEPFTWKDNPSPWGLAVPKNYINKLQKHKHMVYSLIPNRINRFIDISAGSGRFSIELANRSEVCFLCDISVDSAIYLTGLVLKEKIENVLVVRCDYTSLPFKSDVFDFCLCNDTLIYGPDHEKNVLLSIYEISKKGGSCVLDFSNKYHRGFWHKPYTYGYSKRQMIDMLLNTGFKIDVCLPLYYEFAHDIEEKKFITKLINLVVPPTRYVFRVVK